LAVAAELGLPRWWLNEQASTYVAPGGDPAASRVFDHPGLRVFAASPEHLLAMKAFAARPRDAEDIRQLAQVLDLPPPPTSSYQCMKSSRTRNRPRGSGSCWRTSSPTRATNRYGGPHSAKDKAATKASNRLARAI
jgi:hypothetical protein